MITWRLINSHIFIIFYQVLDESFLPFQQDWSNNRICKGSKGILNMLLREDEVWFEGTVSNLTFPFSSAFGLGFLCRWEMPRCICTTLFSCIAICKYKNPNWWTAVWFFPELVGPVRVLRWHCRFVAIPKNCGSHYDCPISSRVKHWEERRIWENWGSSSNGNHLQADGKFS